MEQFEISRLVPLKLFGFDVSFTNSTLWMVLGLAAVCCFLMAATRGASVVPGRLQSAAEMVYGFIHQTVIDICGPDGKKFFPFIFTLFIFILASNVLGLIPGSFTVTSHLSVTLALAMLVFVTVTVVGFARNGIGYLRMFAPEGVPGALLPLIIIIELISYLMRPISLSVRLFANMIAGHMVILVFLGIIILLKALWLAPFSVAFAAAIYLLEIFIGFVQAFIFTLLSTLFISMAAHPQH